MLNSDVMFCISSFLTLPEYLRVSAAWREFVNIKNLRIARKSWCIKRLVLPIISPGRCSNTECTRQKLYCIYLEPLQRTAVSLYCGPCTKKIKNINLLILI